MNDEAGKLEMKVRVSDATWSEMAEQKKALGFFSEASLAAVYLNQLAKIPPAKVWEALGALSRYQAGKRGKK